MAKDKLEMLKNEDPEMVVKKTAINETVKQTSKLPSSEQLNVTEDAVNEELSMAREKGQISTEDAVKVKENLRNNKTGGSPLVKQFTGALKFLMPQMVGAAVGGLAGGGDAALDGATKAGEMAKGFRDEMRANAQLKLQDQNNQRMLQAQNRLRQTQSIDAETGKPLLLNEFTGEYIDPDGNVVPTSKINVSP